MVFKINKEFKSIYRRLIPYLLLFYLCIWQSFALLKAEETMSLQYLSIVSGFVVYFLLIQINQKLFKAVLIFSFLLSLLVYPTQYVYGSFDKNLISSLLFTNAGEASSYIKVVPLNVYINLILLLILTIALLKLKFRKVKNIYLTWGAAIYLLIPPVVYFFSGDRKEFRDIDRLKLQIGYTHIPILKIPLLAVLESYQVIQANDKISAQAKLPCKWKIINQGDYKLKRNIVVVIGESVRKDFWHNYGFPIGNTPFTDSTPHLRFDHFISAGAYTVASLIRTIVYTKNLSRPPRLSDNIVNLAKIAGYKTYWISNQGYLGIYDSPISTIAEASNEYYKFNGGDFHMAKMDKDMLPLISKVLKTDTVPKVIFIHMIGSHPNVCDRTGWQYDQFVLSNAVSCYIKSIKNTDAFLSAIYHDLLETQRSFGLIYFSDHGLKINEDLDMVHGQKTKEAHDVPLLIWDNTIDSTRHFSAYRNGKDFLSLFCGLYGIKTSNITTTVPFLSEIPVGDSVFRVVEDGDEIFDYRKLEPNPIPELKQ